MPEVRTTIDGSISRNSLKKGEKIALPKPTRRAIITPNFMQKCFVSLKSAPLDRPVTATLVITPDRMLTGLDKANNRACTTLNSAYSGGAKFSADDSMKYTAEKVSGYKRKK